jgi:hypothetical protein
VRATGRLAPRRRETCEDDGTTCRKCDRGKSRRALEPVPHQQVRDEIDPFPVSSNTGSDRCHIESISPYPNGVVSTPLLESAAAML